VETQRVHRPLVRITWLAATCWLASLPVGCGGDNFHPTGVSTAAIVNGQQDGQHTSVGLVVGKKSVCSGTLVGHRTALTAAHCVFDGLADYEFVLEGESYLVVQAVVHPDYTPEVGQWHTLHELAAAYGDDLAVLTLRRTPDVTPTAISSAPPYGIVDVTVVGYGKMAASETGYGSRLAADTEVHDIVDNMILFSSEGAYSGLSNEGTICSGDSGGPTFAVIDGQERQVGVHTISDKSCALGADERVDLHLAWIDHTAAGDVFVDDAVPPPPQGCSYDVRPVPPLWPLLVLLAGLYRRSRSRFS